MLPISNFKIDSVKESIQHDLTEIVNRFAKTIGFLTISAPGEFSLEPFFAMHEFSRNAWNNVFSNLSWELHGEASILLKWQGSSSREKPIMLTAHQDIVPAGDKEQWSFPPFEGVVAGGRIYGRGTIDYKCGFAGMLEAVSQLLKQGFQPARTVYLAFGHDEEVGGLKGAAAISAFLKANNIRCSSVLDEGGYIYDEADYKIAEISIAEKGYASFKLTAKAVQGHSSVPTSTTAIGLLSSVISLIENSVPPIHKFPAELDSAKWLATTIAPTIFTAGCKENVLPATAHAIINTRPAPGSSIAEVLSFLIELAEPFGVEVELLDNASVSEPSIISSTTTRDFAALQAAISTTLSDDIKQRCGIFPAATDSRRYMEIADNVYRFMPVSLGPRGIASLHSIDESISVSDYLSCVEFYARYITELS